MNTNLLYLLNIMQMFVKNLWSMLIKQSVLDPHEAAAHMHDVMNTI